MYLAFNSLSLWLCVALAGTMGYAIQRGATCTVIAVDEVITKGSWQRLQSMLEASLWVLGCLLLAQATGLLLRMPPGFSLAASAVSGGLLLGLGAYINRACVFGAVARLGSGQWAYLLTPVGFFAGCALFQWLLGQTPAQRLAEPSWAFRLPAAVAWLALALMLWQATRPARTGHSLAVWRGQVRAAWLEKIWSPHAATLVIGLTFVLMFLLAGPWAYTDVLAEWAMQHYDHGATRAVLLAALFGGALWGGWTAGRWKHTPATLSDMGRCLLGGALMGLGSMWIPGGNDGLILMGMPLLWPYAWVAFATMCGVIALAIVLARRKQ